MLCDIWLLLVARCVHVSMWSTGIDCLCAIGVTVGTLKELLKQRELYMTFKWANTKQRWKEERKENELLLNTGHFTACFTALCQCLVVIQPLSVVCYYIYCMYYHREYNSLQLLYTHVHKSFTNHNKVAVYILAIVDMAQMEIAIYTCVYNIVVVCKKLKLRWSLAT